MSVEATETKKRTMQEIQAEYTSLCNKAGFVQYQIYLNEKDLELINGTLRSLNSEAAALKAEQDAARRAEESAKPALTVVPEQSEVSNG